MMNLVEPKVHMQMAISSIDYMIELYHEEYKCNPTTIIYGNDSREVAIQILHSVPSGDLAPVIAFLTAVLQQVYYIPHLDSRWGVLGVEGMAMSEGV